MENHTAKHFVLQLGSLVGLYLSLSFLLVLLFGLINILFPDATDSVYQIEQYNSSVRLGIAMVIVFFPAYIALTRVVNKNRRRDKKESYLGLTKWLIYLTLLVAGLALLIDLVVVIMTFLEGEITQRFILKALALLLVVGSAFYYYFLDARGHWLKREKSSIYFGVGATIVVFMSIVLGFGYIDTPAQVREQKLDETQITDLRDIQWKIQDYLILNGSLPQTLDDLIIEKGLELPTAPEGRTGYRYEITESGFQLCATFAAPSRKDEYLYARPAIATDEKSIILNPDNWEHGKGEVCFERIVK